MIKQKDDNSDFFEQEIIYLHHVTCDFIDVAFLYEFETKLRVQQVNCKDQIFNYYAGSTNKLGNSQK